MEQILRDLEGKFPGSRKETRRSDLAFVTVPRSFAVEAITWLRDSEGYSHLALISAVDYIEQNIFQLTYILHNRQNRCDIGLRVELERDEPVMESIHRLWATAQVYQRELKEMFGIDFPGSPRIDEPFILEGWREIPPMRRDFDTKKYSEETFFPREGRGTLDPKRVMEEKSYPVDAKVKYEIRRLVRDDHEE
jgi:NADH-quinone oxidoreductase subunit C